MVNIPFDSQPLRQTKGDSDSRLYEELIENIKVLKAETDL